MKDYDIHPLSHSSILTLSTARDRLKLDPGYQRESGIWDLQTRQTLIDSVLNEFDLGKLYFHKPRNEKWTDYDFAIVDGRQRLESIFRFMDGVFPLDKDFTYFKDENIDVRGLTFLELQNKQPKLAAKFLGYTPAVMVIETDELDFIEDMFTRLNLAEPLNAAEKRNAFGAPLPKIYQKVAEHKFFGSRVKISGKRYRHRDIAAKIILLENKEEIVDLKKPSLDEFTRAHKGEKASNFNRTLKKVTGRLDDMQKCFIEMDHLLRSTGMIVTYYWLFSEGAKQGYLANLTRRGFQKFDDNRAKNRVRAERNIAEANYELLDFDRLIQSSNDAYANRERVRILKKHLKIG